MVAPVVWVQEMPHGLDESAARAAGELTMVWYTWNTKFPFWSFATAIAVLRHRRSRWFKANAAISTAGHIIKQSLAVGHPTEKVKSYYLRCVIKLQSKDYFTEVLTFLMRLELSLEYTIELALAKIKLRMNYKSVAEAPQFNITRANGILI